ncbi:MAG: adenosylcobinamide kinase/adenosylcobinamide phosphate guanyltransferase [Coriobacteriia bacterium]|nr:adenosylcobinamide kinase/adenosylcobinamide phosphate guanyltransferase [Coriobacteriia bacterium]
MALVVFTGGARSGKSRAAQRLAETRALDGTRVVVAVFGREEPLDAEFAERVARHRASRPAGFETLESRSAEGWMAQVPSDALLVVDCLGTLLGLAMETAWEACTGGEVLADAGETAPAGLEAALDRAFEPTLTWLLSRIGDTIVVTNEVGGGVVPAYLSGRIFRDALGRANRRIVDRAESAYLCVAGRLVDLSVLPQTAPWPED